MVTPNDLIQALADLTQRYNIGNYHFRNGNFLSATAVNVDILPLVVYTQKNATVGQNPISISFDLQIIRTPNDYMQCNFDFAGASDGFNPPDKMDYQFIDYLLQGLQRYEASCGKYWKVTSGNATEINSVDAGTNPDLQGCYMFWAQNITAEAVQPQVQNILNNTQIFKPTI